MDAVKYLKEKARMAKVNKDGYCTINCDECDLSDTHNGRYIGCGSFENLYPEEAVAIMEKWVEEHKAKTRAQVFFGTFPDAPRFDDGTPYFCPSDLGLSKSGDCPNDCVSCWQQPAPEKYQEWSDK